MNEDQIVEQLARLILNTPPSVVPKGCSGDALHVLVSVDTANYLVENGVTIIPERGLGDFSDGYHTFNELYCHRAVLFSVICNACPDKAWKSKLHDSGDMYDGMFIVGIDTPQGQATYHYDIDPYWNLFRVKELDRAPKWDGHTPAEAIDRIRSLMIRECAKQEDSEGFIQTVELAQDWNLPMSEQHRDRYEAVIRARARKYADCCLGKFAEYLIDRAEGCTIFVSDLPDLVKKFREEKDK